MCVCVSRSRCTYTFTQCAPSNNWAIKIQNKRFLKFAPSHSLSPSQLPLPRGQGDRQLCKNAQFSNISIWERHPLWCVLSHRLCGNLWHHQHPWLVAIATSEMSICLAGILASVDNTQCCPVYIDDHTIMMKVMWAVGHTCMHTHTKRYMLWALLAVARSRGRSVVYILDVLVAEFVRPMSAVVLSINIACLPACLLPSTYIACCPKDTMTIFSTDRANVTWNRTCSLYEKENLWSKWCGYMMPQSRFLSGLLAGWLASWMGPFILCLSICWWCIATFAQSIFLSPMYVQVTSIHQSSDLWWSAWGLPSACFRAAIFVVSVNSSKRHKINRCHWLPINE